MILAAADPADLTPPSALDRLAIFADPLVRVTVGLLLIPHGAQKLFGWFGGFGLTAPGQYFDTTLGMRPGVVFATLAALVELFGGQRAVSNIRSCGA